MNRTERRSHGKKRKPPLALLVVPVVLIAGAVVLVLVLTGHGGTISKIIPGHREEPVPKFDFKASKVEAIGTAENADPQALQPKAQQAATATMPVLDTIFTEAFLDPNNWKDGSYDSAFEGFSDQAATSASGPGLATMTLGANAGDTYQKVSPSKGSIKFDVLFDRDGNAFSVAAHVKFYALAQRTDDTYVAIVSHGVMFLRPSGDTWQVVGFDMKRNDHETQAPTASSSGAPSSGASGSSSSGGTGAS